jgi:hypothetical protein
MKQLLCIVALLWSFIGRAQKVKADGIQLSLTSVNVDDNLLRFEFLITNRSAIAYHPGYIEYVLSDKKQSRRTAQQETVLVPLNASDLRELKGNAGEKINAAFRGFMIPKNKVMIVRMSEDNGARALQLKIMPRKLLKAKMIRDGTDTEYSTAQ